MFVLLLQPDYAGLFELFSALKKKQKQSVC